MDKVSVTEEIEFVCNVETCSRENGDKLLYKGSVPERGSIYLRGNEILIESIYNGKYYANNETGEVVITETLPCFTVIVSLSETVIPRLIAEVAERERV